jgi:hypothetical protein
MRKALIREIAPVTVLDWVEAEEYVMSQYQSMRFRNWQKVILEHCDLRGGFEISCQACSLSSKALASFKSRVSKPSVNQP